MAKVSIPSPNVSFFENIVVNDMEMTFDLHNNKRISVPYANAIRRILMSDLKMVSISKKFIHFIRNTTMLNDSMLANRLTLIPINEDWVNRQSFPMSEIEVRYHRQNRGDFIQSIYVSDFEVCHIHPETLERRVIRDHELFPRPRILFAKMKPGQELNFTALLDNKTAIEEGSIKGHTCSAIFTYKKDNAAIERHISENGLTGSDLQDFMLLESAKKYLMNEDLEPVTYQFLVESIGIHSPDKLIEKTLDRLKEKLEHYLPLTEDRITIERSNTAFMAYDFVMENEDDTLGNIISHTLGKKENVAYAGYAMEHPLIKKIIIRLSLGEEEKAKDKHIEKMREIIQELITITEELKEEWRKQAKSERKGKQKVVVAAAEEPSPPAEPTVEEASASAPAVAEVQEAPAEAIPEPEEPKKKKTIRRKTKKEAN